MGLICTLLIGTTLAWFAQLVEKHSPLFEDFEGFIKEFEASFEDIDCMRTTLNKSRRLRQGNRLAFAYVAVFRLLAFDIPWDDAALIDQLL